ncbi:hypothetical protein FPOA_03673 [Fusarium poae]|uniref:Cofilin n=1 Tax=Fusarium poae TaxID=36050 RepID=A0A1B8ARY5_FUSPO|nr:hypothetical protein FPOA_03673 [Fusarium poae]
MASGVGVSDHCLQEYQGLKLKNTYRYIIYKLNKTVNEIIVDRTSKSEEWDDFLADLPETEPRYAVYDFEFEKDDGTGAGRKIVFVSWTPDSAKVKDKMVYASSKDALRRALVAIGMEIQATEHDEISYETVVAKANRRH